MAPVEGNLRMQVLCEGTPDVFYVLPPYPFVLRVKLIMEKTEPSDIRHYCYIKLSVQTHVH